MKPLDARLLRMLSFKRPHGTPTELNWTDEFIMPYRPTMYGDSDTMAYVITVGESNVLFSCHVDTMHQKEGKQKIHFENKTQRIVKRDKEPLGADDTAGCWLMLEMIDAKVPGAYIFHRGEECGGVGSGWIADHMSEWLAQFDYAIAFDRRATHSVITHQARGRCCSNDFAQALADKLNAQNEEFIYMPDDSGVYTDTAEYVDFIAECTNISVGYDHEHTASETLFVPHLTALRDACIALNWSSLPVTRKPGEDDYHEMSWFRTTTKKPGKVNLYALSLEEMRELAWYDPEDFADRVFMELNGVPVCEGDESFDYRWSS